MPVVVHRVQPDMTTSQALAQQAQGLYARAASLLQGIAEEDEAGSPRSLPSTCSSSQGQGRVAVGKAVMSDGQPPSKMTLTDDQPCDKGAMLPAAEKGDCIESLESKAASVPTTCWPMTPAAAPAAATELHLLQARLRAAEDFQASQRSGFEAQLASGDAKLRETQARFAALEAHQAVESVSSRERCREEVDQALKGLRESHRRESEEASQLLTVATGEAREEALAVKSLRSEAVEQTARWVEDRQALLGESHQLQADLKECNRRLAELEAKVYLTSESAARSELGRLEEVEAQNAANALVAVELRGFEERIAAIQYESDQACRLARAEARAEAAEAAEAVAKLTTFERERAEDVEAACRMHADARQALEHLCHFVGRSQLGEDDVQAVANAEVAAASAEAAGLREELHHHFHAQRDLRQELSALSSAAAAVRSTTEAKDDAIVKLQAKVLELQRQQVARNPQQQQEGLSVPPSHCPELESSGVPPAQRSSESDGDLTPAAFWNLQPVMDREESHDEGDAPSVNNLGTFRSDCLTESSKSVEMKHAMIKPLIETSGSRSGSRPDTPQLGTRELPPDSPFSATTASAAVTQLEHQLACCLPGEEALPSAVAAAAVTAVKAALASLSKDTASKLLQDVEVQEAQVHAEQIAAEQSACFQAEEMARQVRELEDRAPSMGSTPSQAPVASPSPERRLREECEGFASEQRSMTDELQNDISRLRRILFERSGGVLQQEEEAKRIFLDASLARPSGPIRPTPSFVTPSNGQVVQGRANEAHHSKPDTMTFLSRERLPPTGDTTPKTRDRTVSPHPRDRTGSMHSAISDTQPSRMHSTVSDNQPPLAVPYPIPHRRGLLVEKFGPQTSPESLETCTPLCRSQQTLPPDTAQNSNPGTPKLEEKNTSRTVMANQDAAQATEPRQHVPEGVATWENRVADRPKRVEGKTSVASTPTRPRTPSPVIRARHPSPLQPHLRTIQVTARSADTAPSPAVPTPPVPTSLQPRFTTPPPGRLTPKSGEQQMVLPPGSVSVLPSSHWQQRVNAACSIQTLEQTLHTLKLRAGASTCRSAEAPCVKHTTSSQAAAPVPTPSPVETTSRSVTPSHASSMPMLSRVRERSLVVTRQTTPVSSAASVVPSCSDGLRSIVRVASPLARPMSERDCSPARTVAGRYTATPRVSVTPPPSTPNAAHSIAVTSPTSSKASGTPGVPPHRVSVTPPPNATASGAHCVSPKTVSVTPPGSATASGAHSVSPVHQRLSTTPVAPATPPCGRPPGSVLVQRSRVCWQSSRPNV